MANGKPQGEDLVQQLAHELGITDEDNWDLMDELRASVEADEHTEEGTHPADLTHWDDEEQGPYCKKCRA